jgi:hypothetical protein
MVWAWCTTHQPVMLEVHEAEGASRGVDAEQPLVLCWWASCSSVRSTVAEPLKHAAAAAKETCRDTWVLLHSGLVYAWCIHSMIVIAVCQQSHLPGCGCASDYCLVMVSPWVSLYIPRNVASADSYVVVVPRCWLCRIAYAVNARSVPHHPVLSTTVTYLWGPKRRVRQSEGL